MGGATHVSPRRDCNVGNRPIDRDDCKRPGNRFISQVVWLNPKLKTVRSGARLVIFLLNPGGGGGRALELKVSSFENTLFAT